MGSTDLTQASCQAVTSHPRHTSKHYAFARLVKGIGNICVTPSNSLVIQLAIIQ